jgi:hypothetical protein
MQMLEEKYFNNKALDAFVKAYVTSRANKKIKN